MCVLVGDTIYWSYFNQIWAHDTSNHSTWLTDSSTSFSAPGMHMELLVGDTIYFGAREATSSSDWELWAYDTSNGTTWQVVEIRSGSLGSSPGQRIQLLVGDTIYFDANDGSSGTELWAHDTSNHSTWQVADINSASGGSSIPQNGILVDDTMYFSARDGSSWGSTGNELWAHRPSSLSLIHI